MIQLSRSVLGMIAAPSIAPGAGEHAIDLQHLSKMTLGERALEREVLELFHQQATMLTGRMREAAPAVIAASAHTLKGSARGIGAWRVARAAEAVERAASDEVRLKTAVDTLGASVSEAKAEIADLLRSTH
jgi:HPt (histidine-containing phosphotransfer) domain-containing protein